MGKNLNFSEVVKLSDLLKSVFIKVEDNWHWRDGWNDERVVAELAIPGINVEHSKRLRRKLLGEPARVSAKATTDARIKDLDARLARTETMVMDLLGQVERQRLAPLGASLKRVS
jgi:hypothetical protein